MDSQELCRRLASFPRIKLAETPTPLEYLPRLSHDLGCEIYFKRDDEMGPGLGGNKTRKLEYLLAEAQQRGSRKVVTFGGLQSNHARITAAAARKCGMETHLFYFDHRPGEMTGNLLVNDLLGAKMHFIPFGGGNATLTLEATIRLVNWLALVMVGPHYFIPVGGHNWLGCLGYVKAAEEIDSQAKALGIEKARLVVAAGSGGTLAGLLAGLSLAGSSLKVLGIDVGKLWKGFSNSIAHLSSEICDHLGEPRSFSAEQIPLIENTYVGQGYAIPWKPCQEAMRRLASLEGILLDPVYTGKAFTGLLDLIERGEIGRDEPSIFLHTGGLPAIFAFDHG